MSVTIYHNPRCSKSRATLALLEEKLTQEQRLDIAELGLKEQELRIKAEQERVQFDASQELEGIKLGREIAKDNDSE